MWFICSEEVDVGGWLVDNAGALWGFTFASIAILSLLPADSPESQVGASFIWNFGHVPAYAVLAAATLLVLSKYRPVAGMARILTGLAVLSLAAVLELLQPLVGRTASIADVGYGALGAFVGVWTQAMIGGRVHPRVPNKDVRDGP